MSFSSIQCLPRCFAIATLFLFLPSTALAEGAQEEHAQDAGAEEASGNAHPKNTPETQSAKDTGVTQTADESTSLMVRIEPARVKFAEPFMLVVSMVRRKGERLSLPNVLPEKKAVRQSGDVLRRLLPLPLTDGGQSDWIREEIQIPFLALDLEEVETPEFVLTGPNGKTIEVPSLPVEMVSADDSSDGGPAFDPGKMDLAGARTHHQYTVPDYRPLIAFFGLLLTIVSMLVWRFVLSKIKVTPPIVTVVEPVPVRIPAHIKALKKLEALLSEGLLQSGDVALFVTRLMDEVLRDYLADRFSLPAGQRTTKEICEDLLGLSVPGLDVGLSKKIMEDADLVKFARAGLPVDTVHQMAGRVKALIEATRERDTEDGGPSDV
jgi:hypothetical protein